MKQFELPYFGKVDVENITEEQEYLNVKFQERELILMWFAELEIEEGYLQNAKNILADLDKFNENCLNHIQQEFVNSQDKTILEFLEYHLEELPTELSKIIGVSTLESEKIERLLNALKLKNISFHDYDIVADYVIDEEVSDQILAIGINNNGEKNIAWES